MNKIFIYHIGEKEKIQPLLASIPKDFEVEVGPSDKDHKKLMNIPYYRESYEQGIFSFCSDVYRFYKTSTDKGLYIDTTVMIGKNFSEFYEKASKTSTWLFRLNDLYLNCPVIYGDHSTFFKDCFEFYKKYKKDSGIRDFIVGPKVVTWHAHIKGYTQVGDFSDKVIDNVSIGNVLDVRNKNTIYKIGGGSWFKGRFKWINKFAAKQGWKKFEKDFKAKKQEDVNSKDWEKLIRVGKAHGN